MQYQALLSGRSVLKSQEQINKNSELFTFKIKLAIMPSLKLIF